MKYAILSLALMLTACSTPVPVIVKFPDAPVKSGATQRCPQLKKLQDDPTLSDVSKTIALNYGTYYECAIKSDTWIEWYGIQKEIFEKAGK
jgi:hypothetical protein